MRRVMLGLLATVIGTTVLLGLKAPRFSPFGVVAAAPLDPAAGPAGDGSSPSSTPSSRPAERTSTTKPARKPSTSAPTSATNRPSQTRTTTAAPATRTILGNAYPAKEFGDVQVRVIMTGSHIDDIQVVTMSNRPLNAPEKLRQEALAKQSANLTNVSGATYTCQAYMRSLQSALDKA